MPLYDVEHTTPLTSSQRSALAEAITRIHSETFTTPKLFVNVRFVDLRQRKGESYFVAGKEKHATNRIIANVRPSSDRTQAMWKDVCTALTKAWTDTVINSPSPSPSSSPPPNNKNSSSSAPSDRKNSFLSNSNSRPDLSELKANGSSNHSKSSAADDKQLRGIFILGTITAGMELGISLPPAGGDVEWMRENMSEFERLAGKGDEEFREMIEDIGERGLLD